MKIRNGFVSNSSSSSFIIVNKSNKSLTLVDFIKENPQLIQEWNNEYGYNDNQEDLIKSSKKDNIEFFANSTNEYMFGDEDGTLVGKVFDYILRNGGESKNFKWYFYKSYR